MRIVIDMQGAQTESRFRGIGRYTLSLAKAIVRNRGEHEIILALNGLLPEAIESIRTEFNDILPQENIRVWYTPGLLQDGGINNKQNHKIDELIREAFLKSLQPDVILISSLFEGYLNDAITSIGAFDKDTPVAVVLYDLIPLLNSDVYLKPNPDYANFYKDKISYLKSANKYLAISECTARDGVSALNLSINDVDNISGSCDTSFKILNLSEIEKKELYNRIGINKQFVMYTGGADERKNLHRLIKAYALLPLNLRKTHQLVLVGKMPKGSITDLLLTISKSGLTNREVIITGYVDDKNLVKLYNCCKLFIFPSIYEGFGLPALEAMSCGAVVIGSNTTSIREVIGQEDALFDPNSIPSILTKLNQAITDEDFRDRLIIYGKAKAKTFSWDESAKRAVYSLEKLYLSKINIKKEKEEDLLSRLINIISGSVSTNISISEKINIANAISCINEDNLKKQLFVDISELVQRDSKSGVQRVTRSILKELMENPPEGYIVEPVYATTETQGYIYARQFISQFRGLVNNQSDEKINYNPGDIFLGLDLQHHVVIAQKDYLVSLRSNGVKVFFVVYDLLPVLMPKVFHPQVNIIHETWLKTLLNFDGIVCISRAVADELKEWYKINYKEDYINSFKINWFHLGSDVENSVPTLGIPDNAEHVLKELSYRPTFLTVGTVEPRKGQAQILNSFELLWNQNIDINLVIVGKQGWMVESLVERLRQHSKLNKRLFWLEGISDEYLEKIYSVSTCLIAASEGEGFGLPLIEAARHKIPIIARDIPVFREVAGEHAFYFGGLAPQDLSEAINKWLVINVKGKAPQSTNMPWLTWKQSTQQLLKVIFSEINYSDSEKINQINIISKYDNKEKNFRKSRHQSYFRKLINMCIVMAASSRFRKPLKKIYYKLRLNRLK